MDEIGAREGLPAGPFKPYISDGEGVRSFLSEFAQQHDGPAAFSTILTSLMYEMSTPLSGRPVESGYTLELVSPTTAARFLLPALREFYLRGSQMVVGGKVVFGQLRDDNHALDTPTGRRRLAALARYIASLTCGHSRLLTQVDILLRTYDTSIPLMSSSADLGALVERAAESSGLVCSNLGFGDRSLKLVATLFLGLEVQSEANMRTEAGNRTMERLGSEGKIILSGPVLCCPLMPASSFLTNVRSSTSERPLIEALRNMVACDAHDIGTILEDFHLWWEVACSESRTIYRSRYTRRTLYQIYSSARYENNSGVVQLPPSADIFCGSSDILRKVQLDFSTPRKTVASRDLSLLLEMAKTPSKHAQLLRTVWRTSTAHRAVDGVIFFKCSRAYGTCRQIDLVMLLLSLKSTAPGMDGSFSASTVVPRAWSDVTDIFGSSWEEWDGRVAMAHILRRNLSVRIDEAEVPGAPRTIVCGLDGLQDLYGRMIFDVGISIELLQKAELMF